MRLALDTNVMVYAEGLEFHADDRRKATLAVTLIDNAAEHSIILARQALAELYAVLVSKGRVSVTDARARVETWSLRSELIDTDRAVFEAALDLAADHAVPIFDAVILASAAAARCDFLLSEDFHDGFAWRGVAVTNPFGPSPDPRVTRLLAASG